MHRFFTPQQRESEDANAGCKYACADGTEHTLNCISYVTIVMRITIEISKVKLQIYRATAR